MSLWSSDSSLSQKGILIEKNFFSLSDAWCSIVADTSSEFSTSQLCNMIVLAALGANVDSFKF